MPNWCHTNVNVYSNNTAVIRELHKKIKSITHGLSSKVFDADNWMGNLLMLAGCDYDDIKSGKYGYVESYVMEIGDYVEQKGFGSFAMDLMDKWSPDIKAVRSLIAKLCPGEYVRIAYVAEEPGLEIFEKYDPEGLFYSLYDYYVDYIIPEEVSCIDYPEIITDIGAHTELDIIKAFGTDVFGEVKERCREITEEFQNKYLDGCYIIHQYDILGREY